MKTIAKTCAIYTRKSTDERLDMEFNTLDAQREACEAYIMSQRSEGWQCIQGHYDDGGFSGGSLERPALTQLLEDIKADKIDIVVVYKIDRLTRSLADFAKLVEVLDRHGVTFVSVTQSFNTTTSMGRLTLNVLLSFAQFEREVTSERIRDKIAASKAKGMWQGGRPPLGFDIENRRLITNETDAKTARLIFELYLKLGNTRLLEAELKRRGIMSRKRISEKGASYGGTFFSRGALCSLLKNPVYIGKISHKGKIHDGLHDAIVTQDLWDAVQERFQKQKQCPTGISKHRHTNMLTGRLFDNNSTPYSPVFTNHKNGKRYRYYTSKALSEDKDHPAYLRARFPAHEIETIIEAAIREQLPNLILTPEGKALDYMMQHHMAIPSYELVRRMLAKAIVHQEEIDLYLAPKNLESLAHNFLKITIHCAHENIKVTVPYQCERAQDGSVVINPDKEKDLFDLPPTKLKKLIQGVVWRDEHFDGVSLKSIARREGCSQDYVGSAIFYSFKTLQAAMKIPVT